MTTDYGETQLPSDAHFATKAVRAGQVRSSFHETSEFLALTSGFVFADGEENAATFRGETDHYNYSRVDNPTTTMLCKRMASLDGAGAGWSFSSGMAAIFYAVLATCKSGSRVVASRELFGSSIGMFTLFEERFGVNFSYVNATDNDSWAKALSTHADLVFCETPSNPAMKLVDLETVSGLAKKAGALLCVDNTFATSALQRPFEFGADIVAYSTTKMIDGQGRSIGGMLLGSEEFIYEHVKPWIRCTGPTMAPFNAWVALKGLETLELRMKAQSESALKIAKAISENPKVEGVLYPFLDSHPQYNLAKKQMAAGGQMLSIVLKGNTEEAFSFLDNLKIIDTSNNLGDTKSLAVHCATTTHRLLTDEQRKEAVVPDGLVRISVGLENADDLIEDIESALKK